MELSYLIQSPKFSSVWSQSHQRIANNWRFFTFISNGLWACQPEIENGGLDFGLITKSHRCHVIDPLLVSKALCNSSWPCGSKANELFHGRYTPQSTGRHCQFSSFPFHEDCYRSISKGGETKSSGPTVLEFNPNHPHQRAYMELRGGRVLSFHCELVARSCSKSDHGNSRLGCR